MVILALRAPPGSANVLVFDLDQPEQPVALEISPRPQGKPSAIIDRIDRDHRILDPRTIPYRACRLAAGRRRAHSSRKRSTSGVRRSCLGPRRWKRIAE